MLAHKVNMVLSQGGALDLQQQQQQQNPQY